MPSPYSRRSTSGIAVITTLSVGINDSVEAFSIDDDSGWPSGAGGAFYAQIDDEVIDCASQTAGAVTVVSGGRGASDTPAAAHLAGATVSLVFTSADADDANYTASETVGKITTSQDLLVADGAHSLARLGITNNRLLIVSGSTISWGQATSAMLGTDSVGSAQIAADAVGSSEIAANAVGSSEIAADAVTTSELANDAVETLNILDANVTLGKLASASVNQSKLVSGLRLHNVATSAPTGADGDLWYDTDDELLFAYNGTNWVCITPKSALIATAETRATATYAALSTPGPVVSIVTGTKALVTMSYRGANDTTGVATYMGFAVSGASTVAAADTFAAQMTHSFVNYPITITGSYYVSGLTAGTNVFTAVYKPDAGTGEFRDRAMTVVGIP